MSRADLDLQPPPRFLNGGKGKRPSVKLDALAYVTLLVRADITDPALWPPGMKKGAKALARVREIERRCIAKHGEFDWEKLSRKVQDEYDGLCLLLDRLQDTGERVPLHEALRAAYAWVEWEEYKSAATRSTAGEVT